MIKRKREDNWSTWKANEILIEPAEIKLKYSATWVFPFFTCKKIQILNTNDASMVPHPVMAIIDFDK